MSGHRCIALAATFDVADDLLWQAQAGRLSNRGPLKVGRSGQIGPLIELALAVRATPAGYAGLTVEPPFYHQVQEALASGRISGGGARDRVGVFPLVRLDPNGDDTYWDQWASHAENAARASGLAPALVAGLIGAMGELQNNIFEHSDRPETGLVAYAAITGVFEIVVADAGIGVLASLLKNPEFGELSDSGEALKVAVSDGASRHGRASGRGYGIGQLFRALVHDSAELRFRSGDHALRLWGNGPSLTGNTAVEQKAWLDGFIITARCAPGEHVAP